jgi:TRAP-type C4-dicarboxylate transport system permease large subunit
MPAKPATRSRARPDGWHATRKAWTGLLGPLIIVGGILTGVFTATEAGVIACLYALVIGFFVNREIMLADMKDILVDGAMMTALVSCIIAVSGPIGWVLAYLQFDALAVNFVTSLSQSPTMILFGMAAVMIVLGTFVDSLIVLLVFAPFAIKICQSYGLDVYQVGIVMVM